jgi:hypothetical protein
VLVPLAVPDAPPVRTCATRVESGLFTRRIPPFDRRNAIRAGPLVLLAGEYARRPPSDFGPVPHRPGRFYLQKTVVLVRAGSVVTLRVPRSERRLALAYRRSDWRIPYSRGYRLSDGERAITFRACRADPPSFVPGKHRPVGRWTEFNGAMVVAGAHCATLAVGRVRVRVGFGVSCRVSAG